MNKKNRIKSFKIIVANPLQDAEIYKAIGDKFTIEMINEIKKLQVGGKLLLDDIFIENKTGTIPIKGAGFTITK